MKMTKVATFNKALLLEVKMAFSSILLYCLQRSNVQVLSFGSKVAALEGFSFISKPNGFFRASELGSGVIDS